MTQITFNGINGSTGRYMVPPMADQELVALITGRGEEARPAGLGLLKALWRRWTTPPMGPIIGSDPTKIADVGWAVVFHEQEDPGVRQALQPLIERRFGQVGDEKRARLLTYRPGQSAADWLRDHDVARGSIEPGKVPMYLLVVGDPEQIPFGFTADLDVEYAVGRLHFEQAVDYARYAAGVVEYESAATLPGAKEVAFFAPHHPFDDATALSSRNLIAPLAHGLPDYPAVVPRFGFRQRVLLAQDARKGALMDLLGSRAGRGPSVLFTAGHGVPFDWEDPRQPSHQGAILCQEWPSLGTIDRTHYFSAQDIPLDGCVHGLVAFLFGCYSGGTPSHDQYLHGRGEAPPRIAARSFLAPLPKSLLAHPNGGALACIGHVERAWGTSLQTAGGGPQLLPFYNALGKILQGQPIGCALLDFNERFAALSVSLADKLQDREFGAQIPDWDLAADWLGRNDAGGYLILGDPAVRLRSDALH